MALKMKKFMGSFYFLGGECVHGLKGANISYIKVKGDTCQRNVGHGKRVEVRVGVEFHGIGWWGIS